MMVLFGVVVMITLGLAGSVHLRRTTEDEIFGTDGQRRARTSPDGGMRSNTDRLVAAQRKRARRAERNLQTAGRRRSHRSRRSSAPPPPPAGWWRRTARR